MPIRNYPFSVIRPGDIPRPFLPVTIVNPETHKEIRVYALIDTGADECAIPASFQDVLVDFMPNLSIPLLGVRSFLSNFILTVDYPSKQFFLTLPNT
jgi:hypothetical protein